MRCVVIVAALVAGCATKPPMPIEAWETQEADEPFRCIGVDACAVAWRRAQVWVVQNAGMKIQTATDAVIQTYNAPTYSTRWAFQVLREPQGGGAERFNFSASCGEVPMCGLAPWRMLARFNRAMRAAR